MGDYDDISDKLTQYVNRSTPEAIMDGREHGSVSDDAPSVTDNQGGEKMKMKSDVKSGDESKVGHKGYTVFTLLLSNTSCNTFSVKNSHHTNQDHMVSTPVCNGTSLI